MRGHVNAEALALGREGLLGRRAAARVRAHLASCPRCAELDEELAALPALLALTAAPPMPADLAARLDAVIAAESARRLPMPDATRPATTDATAAAGAPGPDAPVAAQPAVADATAPRARPGLARKVLALAAAVVVLAAGGGYLLSRLPSTSSSTSASRAAAPSAAEGPAMRAGSDAGSGGSGYTVIASGTDYRAAQLPAQIAAVLDRYRIAPADEHPAVPAPQAAPKQAPSNQVLQPSRLAALSGCVTRITGGQRPLMVDESRYNGRPATIIVLAATTQALTEAWVVGPACSASRSDVIVHTSLPSSG
jgi:putative zinc finger protein